VALVPQTSQKAWPSSVRVLGMGEHTFHRDVGLVHRAKTSLSETVKALAERIALSSGARGSSAAHQDAVKERAH